MQRCLHNFSFYSREREGRQNTHNKGQFWGHRYGRQYCRDGRIVSPTTVSTKASANVVENSRHRPQISKLSLSHAVYHLISSHLTTRTKGHMMPFNGRLWSSFSTAADVRIASEGGAERHVVWDIMIICATRSLVPFPSRTRRSIRGWALQLHQQTLLDDAIEPDVSLAGRDNNLVFSRTCDTYLSALPSP